MCGINGLFGIEGLEDPESIVERMNRRSAHRGPDAAGIHLFDNACLGHRRLSIIDLSHSADQPMRTLDGRYAIVFNGEIYNHREIRAELLGKDFRTSSDTEVLLQAYATWGPACLQKLNGMFSFAIWDDELKELFIARDRLGIKPLYYAFRDSVFIFSSEIRSILSTGLLSPKLDTDRLNEYLCFQTVHDPNTLLEGVYSLQAGHYMRLRDAEQEVKKYWDSLESPLNNRFIGPDVHQAIREKLEESVARRLISDVPFGAFLSGGIDSSIMVGLMAQMSELQVNTFSVTFDDKEFSEASFARIIAEKYRTAHHEIKLKPDDFLQSLPDALASMDHPSGDGPNTYIVSRETKKAGVTVAISGLGGDELFAGYPHFAHTYKALSNPWIAQFPMVLRRLAASVLKAARPGIAGVKAGEVLTSLRMEIPYVYPLMREAILQDDRDKLLPATKNENPLGRKLYEFSERWKELPILSQVSVAELETYMRAVLLRDSDQMSMAHALEIRVPFLDHELVELVVGLSDDLKYPHTPKQLLIDSVPGLLPEEIYNRPKMGFTLPWRDWMKGDLKDFCHRMLLQFAERGVLDGAQLIALWNRFLSGDGQVTWSRIWPLVVLENWLSEHEVEV